MENLVPKTTGSIKSNDKTKPNDKVSTSDMVTEIPPKQVFLKTKSPQGQFDDVKSKCKDVIFAVIFVLFRFLRLKEDLSFEDKLVELYAHAVIFAAIFAHAAIFLSLLLFRLYFNFGSDSGIMTFSGVYIYAIVTLCGYIVLGVIVVVSAIFRWKRLWIVHLMSFILSWIDIAVIVFSYYNSLESYFFTVIFILGGLYIISIQGAKYKWAMVAISVVLMVAGFIFHVIMTVVRKRTYTYSWVDVLLILCVQFVVVSISFFFTYFFSGQLDYKLSTFSSKVTEICHAVLIYDFSSENVQKLISTPDNVCSNVNFMLKKIVKNLISYKPYLPMSLINVDDKIAASSATSSSRPGHSNSTVSSRRSSEKGVKIRKESDNLVDSGLKIKSGCLLMITTKGFESIVDDCMKGLDFGKFSELYREYVRIVTKVIRGRRGVVVNIDGSKVVCAFNLQAKVVDKERYATEAGWEVIERISRSWKLKESGIMTFISIVTGEILCGNIGCETLKSFNFHSPKIDLLNAMNLFARKSKESCILIDQDTSQGIKYRFNSYAIRKYSMRNKTEVVVYHVFKKVKKKKENEWMYEISDNLNGDNLDVIAHDNDFQKNENLSSSLRKLFESGEVSNLLFLQNIMKELENGNEPMKCVHDC